MKNINLNSVATRNRENSDLAYIDSNIAIISSIRELNISEEPLVLQGYLFLIVRAGEAVLKVSDVRTCLSKGNALLCSPNTIIENVTLSSDMEISGCFIETNFAQQSMRELNMSYYGTQKNFTVLHFDDEDITAMEHYHNLLARVLSKEPSKLMRMASYHLIHTAAIDLYTIYQKDREQQTEILTNYSSGEQIFHRFLAILRSHDHTVRSVNEVATMLHITPKYFSAICKRMTGKTALEIINEELVNRANILLRDPKQNIKQVALHLGFANQSHFGTFMRRQTGLSPHQIRTKNSDDL